MSQELGARIAARRRHIPKYRMNQVALAEDVGVSRHKPPGDPPLSAALKLAPVLSAPSPQQAQRGRDHARGGGGLRRVLRSTPAAERARDRVGWTIPTAEAVLRLRADYLSGRFHLTQKHLRRFPPGRWRVVEK